MQELIEALEGIVGAGGLLTGEDVAARPAGIWRPDRIQARAIVRPRNTEEVAAVLALCHERRQSVVPQGGLTGLVHGADTAPGDIVLSLERMTEIEEVDPVGRTMTVQAGAVLQKVQEAARAAGLQLALDMGARGSCTIGGNVSTNAGGNRVIRYGMAREQVLGLEAVLADGTVLSSMNHMLKNNAGYDLKQLFMGSEGTLGVITRLVLRLRERTGSENTALVACGSLAAVAGLLKRMDGALGGALSAFEVMWQSFYRLVTSPPSLNTPPLDQDHAFYVLLESLGSSQQADHARFEEALAAAMAEGLISDAVVAGSGRERAALWAIRDDVEQLYGHGPTLHFDVSLRIADMEDYLAEVEDRLSRDWSEHKLWVFGHMGDNNLHLVTTVADAGPETRARVEQTIYGPLERIGGSVSAEHGIGLEKKPWLRYSRSAAEIEVMRRLKRALDPHGILNPGKVFDLDRD